jgi:6-phospho-beta-glucosidase
MACLAGADVVIVQVRVGGYEGRRYDETFPLEFDLCGDEGLGPGGLAAAWRTWPVLRDILQDANSVCPGACVLLLTSPVGLLVRLARIQFPALNLVGVCELPFTTLCGAARTEGLHWTELDWQYIGVNHIGWLYAMRTPLGSVLESGRPLALRYVRLQDFKAEVLAQQKARPGARAAELAALARRVLDTYAQGTREEIGRALLIRPADWYDAAVGPLIAVQAEGEARAIFFLSVPQRQWRPEFAPDDVLEIPHVAARRCLAPRSNSAEPPGEIVERLLGLLCYERAAARAVLSRDRSGVEHALSLHPWVPGSVSISALASRVCAAPPSESVAD